MLVSVAVLAVVFLLVIVRRVGSIRLQIWQIMLLGATAVLLTGQITPLAALNAINLDVILFLFGMFVVGEALEESGYLTYISYKLFKMVKSADTLILLVLYGAGILSAFLMNDTLAMIGTPIVLLLAKENGLPPKLLLLTLAFAVTIGSAMIPIGNPQNILIAINGNIENPFLTFFKYLVLPTVVNLFLTFILLKIVYRNGLKSRILSTSEGSINNTKLTRLSKISLVIITILVALKILAFFINLGVELNLTYIALLAAFPIVALSPKRINIIRKIDWYTLIFFASMFVLMQSVWDSGFFQSIMTSFNVNVTSTTVILAISVILSQFISNVPLVALYLPMLIQAGAASQAMVALAAGSTIAGNLSILGAASNVIIIQNAEKRSGETLTFFEFARIGIPLTAVNILVYWLFLSVM